MERIFVVLTTCKISSRFFDVKLLPLGGRPEFKLKFKLKWLSEMGDRRWKMGLFVYDYDYVYESLVAGPDAVGAGCGWLVTGCGSPVTSNLQPNQNLHFIPNSAAWVKKFCMV